MSDVFGRRIEAKYLSASTERGDNEFQISLNEDFL